LIKLPGSRYFPGLLCLACGALLISAFAPLGLAPLAVLSPALFLYLLRDSPPSRAFRYGYLFGLGMFTAGVNWLHISINLFGGVNLTGSLLITFVLIAFLALYPAVVAWCWRRWFSRPPVISLALALPALWVLGEWFRSWILTGFPWLQLGYSQTDAPLGGLAPVTGIYGISLAVIASSAWLVTAVRGPTTARWLAVAGLAAVWSAGWIAGNRQWTETTGATLQVALIQGAIPQEVKWQRQYRQESFDLYLGLTEAYRDYDLVIWPETAIAAFDYEVPGFLQTLQDRARSGKAMLLTGIPVGDPGSDRYFNGALLFSDQKSTYYKRHLVPFGEYLPFDPLLRPLLNFLRIPMSSFSPGSQPRPLLEGRGLWIGISICYEDTFGEEVIQALPEAGLLVNISNDAWFGDSIAPHQHQQMARVRARETGRYLLRATNTGITAVFDQGGRIISSTVQFRPGVADAQVELRGGATPYVLTGNLPVLILCAGLLGLTRWRGRVRSDRDNR